MAITKTTANTSNIQDLSDKPNEIEGLTADQLKKKFDDYAIDTNAYINNVLIPKLEPKIITIFLDNDQVVTTVPDSVYTTVAFDTLQSSYNATGYLTFENNGITIGENITRIKVSTSICYIAPNNTSYNAILIQKNGSNYSGLRGQRKNVNGNQTNISLTSGVMTVARDDIITTSLFSRVGGTTTFIDSYCYMTVEVID